MTVADLILKLKLAEKVVSFLNPFLFCLRHSFVLAKCRQCVEVTLLEKPERLNLLRQVDEGKALELVQGDLLLDGEVVQSPK